MFALAFVTALFTLTAPQPAWPPLFVLAPRKTARKPDEGSWTTAARLLNRCKINVFFAYKTRYNMEICQSTLCPGLRVSACVRHGAPYGRRVLCLRRVPRPLRTRRKLRTLWPPDHLRPPRNTPAPKETPLRIRRGESRCSHRHTRQRRPHRPHHSPHGHHCT